MDLARAEAALHARTGVAFAAATAAGLPGEFEVLAVDGLRVVRTTSPGLGFLGLVTGVDARTVPGLGEVLAASPAPLTVVPAVVVPALEEELRELGLRPAGVRPLAVRRSAGPGPAAPDGGEVRVTEAVTAGERALFVEVLLAGYRASSEVAALLRAEHASPSVRGFLAWSGDEPVGAAGMSLHERVALLGGAATVPDRRAGGVQTQLLAHRLREARASGADLAVATAAEGSPSARNLVRAGFALHLRRAWAAVPVRDAGRRSAAG